MRLSRLRLAGLSFAVFTTCAAFSEVVQSRDGAPPTQAATADAGSPTDRGYPSHIRPQAHYPQQRRSIVQHYQYPYPEYYHGEETAGFRNPGGRGRYAEYYPPGEHFQNAQDPVRAAKFAQGGGAPDRNEQIAAYNAGTQRYNSIQQSIDNYARPAWGGGFGVGGFGGFY
ncbi:hypothetical protein [Paludisphaera mucosa]|uniref:Uncharacterized protein n=1 Tax=Paludisphaera mucosa TaxID=3030827 RepID=A0ABT6F7F8_9BACT|nr:hypothetical protein [Paludisphaera mucosa]MDG3003504.1 hypothetical protein [Paludisphaera mucosa]